MLIRPVCLILSLAVALPTVTFAGDTNGMVGDSPAYTADGRLVLPANYRQWVFLSAGLGMSYSEKAPGGEPVFDNTFVDPESYRAFVRTGTWPDKTQIVLETRNSTNLGSINKHGHFQSGEPQGIEVHVKDTARFKDGWGFFGFDSAEPAKKIPETAACYSCHAAHAAVDTTFVQFYPTLMPIARKQATLSAAFLKETAE